MTFDHFRDYRQGDLQRVWQDVRPEDKREFRAAGMTNVDMLEGVLAHQTKRISTWVTESGPVAVLGVTKTDNPAVGLVWSIASQRALPRWRFAVRNTGPILDELGEGFRVLSNFKDSRNKQQIDWLRRVGFTFIKQHDVGPVSWLEFVRIVQ